MKKILFILSMLMFTLSCSKETTELENLEKPEVAGNSDERGMENKESTEETKPIINITKDDTLEIYVRGDGAPGMYQDSNGELKGFYVDLEKAVMDEMGQKYNLYGYFDVGPVIQNIRDGIAHSALSVPDLPDYRAILNLSIPFEDLNFVTIVQSDNNEITAENREELIKQLSGKKVGVQTRGHIYQALRDYKEIELVEYPTTTQALDALNKGELYAVPEVKRIMEHYSKINNWDLKAIGDPIITQKITTGFSKALDNSVVDRYNKALQTLIDNGYVAELYNSYFGE